MKRYNNIYYKISYRLHKNKVFYLHIGDLLKPVDGKITAAQYIITGRVLDIENIRAGKDIEWQHKLTNINKTDDHEAKQLSRLDINFRNLLYSLDERGFNPYCEHIKVSCYPLNVNNGTHRIAYAITTNLATYVSVDIDGLFSLYFLDGQEFIKKFNLPNNDLKILNEKFEEINNKVRTSLTGYIFANKNAGSIFDILRKYGKVKIYDEVRLSFGSNRNLKGPLEKLYHYGGDIIPFRIDIFKQKLLLGHRGIFSPYVNSISTEMKKVFGSQWGYIEHSVTKSIALENYMESWNDFNIIFMDQFGKEL